MAQASLAAQMARHASTLKKHQGLPFSSNRSSVWYDDDSQSGAESEDDGDADSLTSAESVESGADTLTTPESSPPHYRHAVLHGTEPPRGPAVGGFDSDGNWAWSRAWPSDGPEVDDNEEEASQVTLPIKPVLNRHDRTQIAMTGKISRLAPTGGALTIESSDRDIQDHCDLEEAMEEEDDPYDVVGFTYYPPRSASAADVSGEGHSIVMPVRIRLEYDSSSDESDGSVVTTSSSGSDSDARRRASFNMLQRLGRNVKIPERHASAMRLGQGVPRRPPSLDEISHRVAGVGSSSYGRRTPPTSAVPHARSVSCPSPILVQRAQFGEVEVMVTPPTPQMATEKILGVVLKSPNMPSSAFATDALGNLAAPAFDVAPGRQIMLEDRQRQAKLWLEAFKAQQQEPQGLNLKVGTGSVAPPVADDTQAAATFASSSPTRCKSPSYPSLSLGSDTNAPMQQRSGGPPIPPRRRSFARKISDTSSAAVPCQAGTSDSSVEGSEPIQPVQVAASDASTTPRTASLPAMRPTYAAPRRSLVARLSLRRSSNEMREERGSLQVPRKPVPAV
ncbi:uncharacterized protein PAN0_001d0063 [Moesziomyces antarcticus]|uniref:Uncharacterized protein n=1 Tax=Pseudozyma antarctica TaxID=84753 RepID=A0A5C3FE60_PSEA2|nr:uncharacterized protein PAN0_001d0063 [Moesziomyces antarcticus]GAK61868.1 conserved hypothetical protein [Moesziomyces antarcticus]SPO42386.1 uncharacterized protein PSANT_00069 [Moesziomyces antarcticus]